MSTEIEIKTHRALAKIAATLNDRQLDHYDREHVQELADRALGPDQHLTVDDGGGLHNQSGARIGAIRRTPSGEWIVDRQNDAALNSDAAIPVAPRAG